MKLLAYILNNKILGVEKTSYILKDLNNNQDFIASEIDLEGYSDIASIENWYKFGDKTKRDYKFVRNTIKNIFYSIIENNITNINRLNKNEIKILSRLFLVPKEIRDIYYTFDEQYQQGIEFNKKSIECRKKRWDLCSSTLYNRLNLDDANEIINELNYQIFQNGKIFNVDLAYYYIQYGREGILQGDPEGIYDYINATDDSSFEMYGIASKKLYPIHGTKEELIETLNRNLKEGI